MRYKAQVVISNLKTRKIMTKSLLYQKVKISVMLLTRIKMSNLVNTLLTLFVERREEEEEEQEIYQIHIMAPDPPRPPPPLTPRSLYLLSKSSVILRQHLFQGPLLYSCTETGLYPPPPAQPLQHPPPDLGQGPRSSFSPGSRRSSRTIRSP